MLKLVQALHDAPNREAVGNRACRMALAGLLAGSLSVGATVTEAATRVARPVLAPSSATTAAPPEDSAPPHVSPYAIANRQHLEAASKAGHIPVKPVSMRRTHQAIGQGQRP